MNGGQDGGSGFQPPGGDPSPYGGPSPQNGPYGDQRPYSAQGPYGGQSPYGAQPPYGGQAGQSPYGAQPPYGGQDPYGGTNPSSTPQTPYGGMPQGAVPWSYGPPPEPPKKSRGGLIIALAIGAVVLVLGGVAVAVGLSSGDDKKAAAADSTPTASSSSTPPSDVSVARGLVVPESVDGYKRMKGSVADRLADNMRKSMEKESSRYASAYEKSKIGIYSKSGDTERPLIFVGLSGADSPEIGEELRTKDPSDEVDSTFLGMGVADAKDYPAGTLGGVLRCGDPPSATGSACVWADHAVLGIVITSQTTTQATLAQTTLDLRNAAER